MSFIYIFFWISPFVVLMSMFALHFWIVWYFKTNVLD